MEYKTYRYYISHSESEKLFKLLKTLDWKWRRIVQRSRASQFKRITVKLTRVEYQLLDTMLDKKQYEVVEGEIYGADTTGMDNMIINEYYTPTTDWIFNHTHWLRRLMSR